MDEHCTQGNMSNACHASQRTNSMLRTKYAIRSLASRSTSMVRSAAVSVIMLLAAAARGSDGDVIQQVEEQEQDVVVVTLLVATKGVVKVPRRQFEDVDTLGRILGQLRRRKAEQVLGVEVRWRGWSANRTSAGGITVSCVGVWLLSTALVVVTCHDVMAAREHTLCDSTQSPVLISKHH